MQRELSSDEWAELQKKAEIRKALLTPEQLAIVARWDAEKAKRMELLEQAQEASKRGDIERERELLMDVCKVSFLADPYYCEHERAVTSTCAGCEEIERILTPELFEENE